MERVVVVGILLTLVLTGVVLWQSFGPGSGGSSPDVLVVGDSVTYLSARAIGQEFDRDHLQIAAKPGYPTLAMIPITQAAIDAEGRPGSKLDTVLVLVGYNDLRVRDLDSDAVPDLVKETSRFRCGVWLTLPARPGGEENPNDMVPSDLVDLWNARLRTEVAKYPNLHVDDAWHDAVTEADLEDLLKMDAVHPNAKGQEVLAKAYKQAMERNC